jgi:hypothetical protein
MTPTTRFVLDLLCWFGTAALLMFWGHPGWAMVVGVIGALYLAYAWTILMKFVRGEFETDETDYE